MTCLYRLIELPSGNSRKDIEELLEPSEANERNEFLARSGNAYKWVRAMPPHRDRD